MEAFKPRPELFRHCCGHCLYCKDRTINTLTFYICNFDQRKHHYGHICDVDTDDHSDQISIFDQSFKYDGNQVISEDKDE